MEEHGRRVIEIELASHLRGGGLHALDVTAHRSLQVDLVDEVHEQGSRPGRLIDTILCEGINQNGEPVIRFESKVMEFA